MLREMRSKGRVSFLMPKFKLGWIQTSGMDSNRRSKVIHQSSTLRPLGGRFPPSPSRSRRDIASLPYASRYFPGGTPRAGLARPGNHPH